MNVMSCLGHLNGLAQLIRCELAAKGDDAFWGDEERLDNLINPITHRLLSQASSSSSEPVLAQWDIIAEALQLGAIIWVILVKRRYGRSFPGTAATYISRLLGLLTSSTSAVGENKWVASAGLRTIRLWLLVLCGVDDEPGDRLLTTLIEMIVVGDMQEASPPLSLFEMIATIRQIAWIDLFEAQLAKLEKHFAI